MGASVNSPQQAPQQAPSAAGARTRRQDLLVKVLNYLVLLLSVLLIVFISVDTFKHINFLDNHAYMTFQFWVCVVFMGSFFMEMHMAADRWRYARRHWLFFLLSIPILNIVNLLPVDFSAQALYFLRFIPLARGALAIAIIVRYFTRNRIASVFLTYMVILVLVVYFCSLIVFEREQPVNPQIPDFGEALWFSSMVVTTIGSNIAPVTVAGKIIQIILATMGMIMFPLFTVYITSTVIRLRRSRQEAAAKGAAPTSAGEPE